MRIHHDVHRAGLGTARQHLLPSDAAVHGAINAALFVGRELMAQGRDEHDVRIARIHDDRTDLLRLFQAHVLPGATRVGRFINAVAGGRVAADASFAHARVDHVGV